MKHRCERCGAGLSASGLAFVCSYECTYCEGCSRELQQVCPHCGGELQVRPRRRETLAQFAIEAVDHMGSKRGPSLLLIWCLSFAFWTIVAILAAWTMYQWRESLRITTSFRYELTLPLLTEGIFAVLTPIVYLVAQKYPIHYARLWRRLLAYAAGGIGFAVVHVAIRVLIYPVRDPRTGMMWGLFQQNGLGFQVFKNVFLYNVVDDIFTIYLPIVIVAHAVVYHKSSKAAAIRAAELSKQLVQAKLQALEMQLHPHFLFNSMNSISALMHIDVSAADKMMSQLGDLLRMTLASKGVHQTTLKKELDFLSTYLNIEQARFGDRLQVALEIAPETLDTLVPHLLLQPLVENAIRHGASKRENGKISISSRIDRQKLHLTISDNGPGFDQKLTRRGEGLGRRITLERLEALYGEDYSFRTKSTSERGTEVFIEIPLRLMPGTIQNGDEDFAFETLDGSTH